MAKMPSKKAPASKAKAAPPKVVSKKPQTVAQKRGPLVPAPAPTGPPMPGMMPPGGGYG